MRLVEDGVKHSPAFLDISEQGAAAGEQGLLSVAFHPDCEASGRFCAFLSERATGRSRCTRTTPGSSRATA